MNKVVAKKVAGKIQNGLSKAHMSCEVQHLRATFGRCEVAVVISGIRSSTVQILSRSTLEKKIAVNLEKQGVVFDLSVSRCDPNAAGPFAASPRENV
jgi:hypothetical protein